MRFITRIWKIIREKVYSLEVKPYRIPFDDLVKRAENRMIIKDPSCQFCGSIMHFRSSNIVTDAGPVRDDQVYKCTNCFHLTNFGLPMTLKDALYEKQIRGGQYLNRPTLRLDERDLKVIIDRLTSLGYIE